MPSARCGGCGGTVSTVRRGQPISEALAQHVRLSHPDRPATTTTTTPDEGDADSEDDSAMHTTTIIRRPRPPVDRLPFFVYGTLRPGMGNDRLWHGQADVITDGEARVHGYRLVGGGIPYAIPADGQFVVGALIAPHDADYDSVLRSLDALEGVPVHYDRIKVTVAMPWDEVEAWMYSPAKPALFEDRRPIPGNDYVTAWLDSGVRS